MQTFVTTWNAISQNWAERILAVVWQSTVLAVVVALAVALLLRHSSPAVRHWVWQILAIKLLIMPFWSWAIPWLGPSLSDSPVAESRQVLTGDRDTQGDERIESDATTNAENTDSHPESPAMLPAGDSPGDGTSHLGASKAATRQNTADPRPRPGVTWQCWLFLAWGAIVLAQVFRLLVQRRRLSRLLNDAAPADAGLANLVAATSERLGVPRVPATLIASSDFSPFVCGIGQPKLILPVGLQEKLTPAELDQVLLHELAHIRRRDLVWSWIGEIARIVYFFHPVAHWINYQVRLERELACDQLAMAVSGHGPNEYAATLVQVVSHASEPSVFKTAASASFSGDRS